MNRIRELRASKGWTQADLAARINTKRQTIGHYETGFRGLDVPTICALCDVFGCSADYLLGRSDLPSSDLTPEEVALLLAWRAAPAEIRAIIDAALVPYRKKSSSSAAV